MPSYWLRLLIALAVVGAAHPARAGDPELVWMTIETDHFAVHYYEPMGDMAHRVAVVAERSHRVLTPVLGHAPTEKTHIVLVDDTDGSNGFANAVPRNAIRLFASAPGPLSVLNDHEDWMYGLVAHEYTHVIHLDTIGGLPALYNQIFGKTWSPNQIQPRWIIEGLATYEESEVSSSGRTRSALFDMHLRVAVLEGEELELDAVSTGPRAYPHGTTPYLYGSHFLKYVFDRYGDRHVATMSEYYGSNPLPFGINKSIEAGVGKGFTELYEEWRAFARRKYRLQLEAIERRGAREGRRLTFSGELSTVPRYSPDGNWLLWREADGYEYLRIMRMPVGGHIEQAEAVAKVDRLASFDPLSDGTLVVEQTTLYRGDYDFQDLYVLDPASGRDPLPLTHGLRAIDPRVSPDERTVAFVVNGRGRSVLAVMPLRAEADHRVVWRGAGRYDQASGPAWSPDGARLAFSAWRAGGLRDILILDLASGEVTEVARDRALDSGPVFDPRGRYLYYTSDRSGVYNVYAYELATGRTWQVTNVVGCAVEPAVSPDGTRLAYRGFVPEGYEIYEITLDPAQWLEPEPYVDDRPDPVVVPDDEVEVSAPRPYRAIETLGPNNYTAQLVQDSWGTAVSVTTNGADIAGLHGWSLGTTLGMTRGDVRVGGAYSYRGLWPTLRISGNRSTGVRGGYRIADDNTRYTETNYGLTARMDIPVLRHVRGSASMSLDYDVDWYVNEEDEFTGPDPNDPLPDPPETDVVVAGFTLSWRYSDVDGANWLVGAREGKSITLNLTLDDPALGSDFRTLTLGYRVQGYYKLPWGATPVLSAQLAGGLSTTDRERVGSFVLGGVPEQDVALAIRGTARIANTGYLRGFERRAFFGRQYHLLNLEYRQLLWNVERGLLTLPVYVRRIHVAGLVDVGNAFSDEFDPTALHTGVGASLRIDVVLGYFAPGSIDIGYAHGLGDEGLGETWFLLTSSL